jgi:hypothetical protein
MEILRAALQSASQRKQLQQQALYDVPSGACAFAMLMQLGPVPSR